VLRGPVTVSTDAYEATRQRYGFEEQHYVLAVPIPDVSLQEFPAWERRAFDELGRIGLANGASVHQDLLDTMQLLAKPPIELHGRIGYHNKATPRATVVPRYWRYGTTAHYTCARSRRISSRRPPSASFHRLPRAKGSRSPCRWTRPTG